jgi:hypothetical protein
VSDCVFICVVYAGGFVSVDICVCMLLWVCVCPVFLCTHILTLWYKHMYICVCSWAQMWEYITCAHTCVFVRLVRFYEEWGTRLEKSINRQQY